MCDDRAGAGRESTWGFLQDHPLIAMAAGAFLWNAIRKPGAPERSTAVPESVDWMDPMARWSYLHRND